MEIDDACFAVVTKFVYERAAIVLPEGKRYLVEARLTPVLRTHELPAFPDLVAEIRKNPSGACASDVVDAMTTNETSWFRDRNPFDALKSQVIPELIERNSEKKKLNVWCGAASTGQEPYSLALLLCEHFPELRDWSVKIQATDLSPTVLKQAASGSYGQVEMGRGLPAPLLTKYFTREGMSWVLAEEVRSLVEFSELNLIDRWPAMPQSDLVFLRNVLIYFDTETKHDILERVSKQMEPHAYLFLGGAESTAGVHDGFERHTLGKSAAYRRATK